MECVLQCTYGDPRTSRKFDRLRMTGELGPKAPGTQMGAHNQASEETPDSTPKRETRICVICAVCGQSSSAFGLGVGLRPGPIPPRSRPRLACLLDRRCAKEKPQRTPERAQAVGCVID